MEKIKTAQTADDQIKNEIKKQFTENHQADLQAFQAALDRLGEFQKKQRDCLAARDLLRVKVEPATQESMSANDATEMIKSRRRTQAALQENEEILASISNDLLPLAEQEMARQKAIILGALCSIILPLQNQRQHEINTLFDQANVLIKDFETQVTAAMLGLIGNYFYSLATPGVVKSWNVFDLSRAPRDNNSVLEASAYFQLGASQKG